MRDQILLGDSSEVLDQVEPGTIRAVVTDPPYGLGTRQPTPEEIDAYLRGAQLDTGGDFMGMSWQIPPVTLWQKVYRVMQPGAVLMAFAGTRTIDLMAAGIEAAGFTYVGTCGWTYGQGFPKSLNIGKALDKMKGAEREVVGVKPGHEAFAGRGMSSVTSLRDGTMGQKGGFARPWMTDPEKVERYHLATAPAPATPEAKQWDGWGTALKPSWEPILVYSKGPTTFQMPLVPFLYAAKASRSERNHGLDELPERVMHELDDQPRSTQSNRRCQTCGLMAFGHPYCECEEPDWEETEGSRSKNHHPSVKPLSVMRWLVRLASPPPKRRVAWSRIQADEEPAPTPWDILDPFLGSGSTAVAAAEEGRSCLGIERDPEYIVIAETRTRHARATSESSLDMQALIDFANQDDE